MRIQRTAHRLLLGAAGLGVAAALTACGAAAAPAPTGHASSASGAAGTTAPASGTPRLKANPALLAAADIIRLQPVVPFSAAQIQKLEPMLQALASHPGESAAQLATAGAQIQAVFTSTQQEALKNMGSQSSPFGGGSGAGRFSRSGSGAGRFSRSGSGAGRFSRSGSGAGPGAGGIYEIALDTLEGKTPTFPGAGGAAPAGGSATSGNGA